jgi:hypothetical protein
MRERKRGMEHIDVQQKKIDHRALLLQPWEKLR